MEHNKIQKLIQTRDIYRKINQKLTNTPDQEQITAKENIAWGNKTWSELSDIVRKIQINEFAITAKRTRKMHTPEIFPGGEEMEKHRRNSKHLLTRKLNRNIHSTRMG